MIAGDYLYTNYICKILMILKGYAESDYAPTGKYLPLSVGKVNLFFMYDKGGRGFILKNQYGERSINHLIKSFMGVLIYKGLMENSEENKRIVINGREVNPNFRVLPLIAYMGALFKNYDGLSVIKCNNKCIFANQCVFDVNKPIMLNNKMDFLHNATFDYLGSELIYYLNDGNIYLAGAHMIDDYFDFNKKKSDVILKLNKVRGEIIREIGYEKANFVLSIASDVIRFKPMHNREIDISEYGGYLVRKGKFVYPSDKLWIPLTGKKMEEKILKIYQIKNGMDVSKRNLRGVF